MDLRSIYCLISGVGFGACTAILIVDLGLTKPDHYVFDVGMICLTVGVLLGVVDDRLRKRRAAALLAEKRTIR